MACHTGARVMRLTKSMESEEEWDCVLNGGSAAGSAISAMEASASVLSEGLSEGSQASGPALLPWK